MEGQAASTWDSISTCQGSLPPDRYLRWCPYGKGSQPTSPPKHHPPAREEETQMRARWRACQRKSNSGFTTCTLEYNHYPLSLLNRIPQDRRLKWTLHFPASVPFVTNTHTFMTSKFPSPSAVLLQNQEYDSVCFYSLPIPQLPWNCPPPTSTIPG